MKPDQDLQSDDDVMMDHVALEAMHAIDAKDKSAFKDAFHVLIVDVLNKMGLEQSAPSEES